MFLAVFFSVDIMLCMTTQRRLRKVQFYPWFKFYFCLFLGMVTYANEFETASAL